MEGALVILVAMVVIGIVLYAIDVLYYRKKDAVRGDLSENNAEKTDEVVKSQEETDLKEVDKKEGEDEGVCCGMHIVCEKTNLSPVTGEIVYYDDEELDRFRGRDANDYTPEEIEEFRDVLLTLLPQDVAGWSRSIQVREITLPTEIRDELLMIVSELRQG